MFAHCFTCGKEIAAASRITRELASQGIAVLRFDFTGIGNSDGDFANSNFSSNVSDLLIAAEALEERLGPVDLLIGHSLGGAAVLAAAGQLEKLKAVVTIGAPSAPAHVRHLLGESEAAVQEQGEAEVQLAGRTFTFRRQFLDDLEAPMYSAQTFPSHVPALLLHSPEDTTVGYENAVTLQRVLPGSPSLLSLTGADHLITRPKDAQWVASLISTWVDAFLT